MAKNKENEERESEKGSKVIRVWDCGSPLYDSYELASLTHMMERHSTVPIPSFGGSKRFRLYHHHDHHKSQNRTMTVNNDQAGSTAVMVPSRKPEMPSGCIGLGRMWKTMRGGRIKKNNKPPTSRSSGIKWFI